MFAAVILELERGGMYAQTENHHPRSWNFLLIFPAASLYVSLQALTRELGQESVDAGAAVKRPIPADRSYITVEPGQTAGSYTAGLRQKYITVLVLAGAYVLLYVVVWCVTFRLRKKRIAI